MLLQSPDHVSPSPRTTDAGTGTSSSRDGVLPPQMLPGDHPSPTQAPSREGKAGWAAASARQRRERTVKLGLLGWILSSASTQMPLVSFRDW